MRAVMEADDGGGTSSGLYPEPACDLGSEGPMVHRWDRLELLSAVSRLGLVSGDRSCASRTRRPQGGERT